MRPGPQRTQACPRHSGVRAETPPSTVRKMLDLQKQPEAWAAELGSRLPRVSLAMLPGGLRKGLSD